MEKLNPYKQKKIEESRVQIIMDVLSADFDQTITKERCLWFQI
jgi:hypothetical protein